MDCENCLCELTPELCPPGCMGLKEKKASRGKFERLRGIAGMRCEAQSEA